MQRLSRRTITVLILLGCTAGSGWAQGGRVLPISSHSQRVASLLEKPVSLQLNHVSMANALVKLHEASGAPISFSPTMLPGQVRVSCDCGDVTLGTALHVLLDGTGFRATVMAEQIVIVKDERLPPTSSLAAASSRVASASRFPVVVGGGLVGSGTTRDTTVTGVVVHGRTGEPVPGAQVTVDGTSHGAISDARGRFRITGLQPNQTVTLRVISMGYRTITRTVTAGVAGVRFELEESIIPLDEVVVTGTVVPTRVRAVPTPISVVTAADIEQLGLTRAEDILRTLAGVGVVTSGGVEYFSRVFARGPSSLTSGFSGIKTYIDGVEVANPQWTLNQIDPASIERIEVIRGPQASTLYGAEAIAGVMQVFTKKGFARAGRPSVEARFAGGGLQSDYSDGPAIVQDHSVSINGGDDRFSYNLGGSFRYTGEWLEDDLRTDGMPDNSTNDNRSFFAGMRYTAGAFIAEATARANRGAYGTPHPPKVVERVRSGRWNASALAEYTKANGNERQLDQRTLGLTLRFSPTARWQHNVTLGYDRMVNEIMRPVARLTTPADSFLYYSRGDEDKLTFAYNTALDVPLGARLHTTLQAGYDQWTYEDDRTVVPTARSLSGDLESQTATVSRSDITNHGFFVQAQTSWEDELFLTLGARADDNSGFGGDYGYAFAPRVGLSHVLERAAFTVKSRVAWGKAIRAPTPVQRTGHPSTPENTYVPNEELGPESQVGYDVGVELYIADRFKLAATYYDQDAKDLISLIRLNPAEITPSIGQYQNVGKVKNTGWEFEGTARFGAIRLSAQYSPMNSTVEALSPTYTGSEFVVGERPPIAPSNTGRASVAYVGGQATLTFAMNHTGSRRAFEFLRMFDAIYGTDPDRVPFTGSVSDYRVDFPSVQRYEMRASWRFNDHLSTFLEIDNLLNDREPELSDIDPVRGRRTIIGARMRY